MKIDILSMSLFGSILIIFIGVMRTSAKNYISGKVFIFLWELVIIRLLIPFSLPISIGKLASQRLNVSSQSGLVESIGQSNVNSLSFFTNNAIPAANQADTLINTPTNINIFAVIWITGIVILFICNFIRYIQEHKKLREALPINEIFMKNWLNANRIRRRIRILTSDKVLTPITIGCFAPKIILPRNMLNITTDELEYILSHELMHIKRFDCIKKFFSMATVCIHWFNPIVWYMNAQFMRDIEIGCDQRVIAKFGEKSKSTYASLLVRMSEHNSHFFSKAIGFSFASVEERIISIMKFKKGSITGIIVVFVFIICAAPIFAASNPLANNIPQHDAVSNNISETYAAISATGPNSSLILSPENTVNFVPITGENNPIYSYHAGKVIYADTHNISYGYQIAVKQPNGITAIYWNLLPDDDNKFVSVGDEVLEGEQIGISKRSSTTDSQNSLYQFSEKNSYVNRNY